MPDLFGNFAASPRPTQYTEAMADKVVAKLLPDVVTWLGNDATLGEADDLKAVVWPSYRTSPGLYYIGDGFELAKELDWSGDSELVEIMDNADSYFDEELKTAVREWVALNNIEPAFKFGDPVAVTGGHFNGKVGSIAAIYPLEAVYVVNIPSLGHAPLGADGRPDTPNRCGTIGTHIPFENVEARA